MIEKLKLFEIEIDAYLAKISDEIKETERIFKKIAWNVEIDIKIDNLTSLHWNNKRIIYVFNKDDETSIIPLAECKFGIRKMVVVDGYLNKLIEKLMDSIKNEYNINHKDHQ